MCYNVFKFNKGVMAMPMSSRKVISILKKDGWFIKRVKGSHCQFAHPVKAGIVTVPHPKKDIPAGTLASIERQSGLKF
jgi:predicted RNA binding protein YcfA (HicA-like mRNA interferase family)